MDRVYLVIPVIGMLCGTALVMAVLRLVSEHFSRRHLSSSAPSDEIMQRLERIEQIVDSTAVEVERLAESNRFVAKLLAEKSGVVPR
jgi:hypothetical protein